MSARSSVEMARRLVTLLAKELRQHLVVLVLTALFLPGAWALFLLFAFAAPTTVSYVEVHATFLRWALVPFAFAVGNRLLVVELYARTQRYLEALPMGRFEPFVVKWALGFTLLVGPALASAVATLLAASAREVIDGGLVASVFSRTVAFVIALWAFLFLMGLIGKLRIPLYVVLALALVVLAQTTELELLRFGPFALVGQELGTSHAGVPWADVGVSLALALAFVVISGVLLAIREGSVQEALSQRLTARELAMVGIAVMSVLMVWSGLQPTPEPLPYQMSGQHLLRSTRLPIVIAYGSESGRDDAERLLARLEPSFAALRDALGFRALPEIRVVQRASLDGRTFESPTLRAGDGALVRTNFLDEASPDLVGLEAALVRSLLEDRTNHRARWEPQRWALDGFSIHWAACGPHRPRSEGADCLSAERRAMAQLTVRRHRVDASRLHAWNTLREQEGERVAESLAAVAMGVLAERGGPDAPARFARSLFATWAPKDSRATLDALLHPIPARLQATTTVSEEALVEALGAALTRDAHAPEVEAILASVTPWPDATLALTSPSPESPYRTLAIDVRVPWASREGAVVTVLERALDPFDVLVEPWQPRRDQFVLGASDATRHLELTGRVSRGDRVLVWVDVTPASDALTAPVRVLAERRDVQ